MACNVLWYCDLSFQLWVWISFSLLFLGIKQSPAMEEWLINFFAVLLERFYSALVIYRDQRMILSCHGWITDCINWLKLTEAAKSHLVQIFHWPHLYNLESVLLCSLLLSKTELSGYIRNSITQVSLNNTLRSLDTFEVFSKSTENFFHNSLFAFWKY